MYNRTGAVTIKGQVVEPDPATDDGAKLEAADGLNPIGVWLEAGVADDALGWVVVSGIAEVLMEDNTAATAGYWVRTSEIEAGHADSTNAAPPGGTVQALEAHATEIGHCLQTVAATGAGTHVLARCILHFN